MKPPLYIELSHRTCAATIRQGVWTSYQTFSAYLPRNTYNTARKTDPTFKKKKKKKKRGSAEFLLTNVMVFKNRMKHAFGCFIKLRVLRQKANVNFSVCYVELNIFKGLCNGDIAEIATKYLFLV